MKGVPLRIEIGPRDIENNQCVIARRVDGEKITVSLDALDTEITKLLAEAHDIMYARALERREKMTYVAKTLEEMKDTSQGTPPLPLQRPFHAPQKVRCNPP